MKPFISVLLLTLLCLAVSSAFSAPYLMRSENDCGPAAIHAVTDVPYEKVCAAMGWTIGHENPNFLDNPAAHLTALKKLGVRYANRNITNVLDGKCKPGKTVILLHSKTAPYLGQHWCILSEVGPDFVRVNWGDDTIKTFTREGFIDAVRRGGPTNTIYEVGVGSSTPKKWFGWAAGILAFFGKILGRF